MLDKFELPHGGSTGRNVPCMFQLLRNAFRGVAINLFSSTVRKFQFQKCISVTFSESSSLQKGSS